MPIADRTAWSLERRTEKQAFSLRATLVRNALHSGTFSAMNSDTLDLFIRNYHSHDEQLIMSALAPLSPDEDEAHSLGSSPLNICDENSACTSLEILKWVCEATPCSVCRCIAVKQMAAKGHIPPEIVAECLDDADEDIRHLAEELAAAN